MLREYQLQNFKAFSGPEKLKISPITLIYGPNSAGKSSIIQSLMLLKQTLEESKELNVPLLSKGSLVDLGNFREFIHLHDIARKFSVRIQIDGGSSQLISPKSMEFNSETIARIYGFLYNIILKYPCLSIELGFRLEPKTLNMLVSDISLWIGDSKVPVITYDFKNGEFEIEKLHKEHKFWKYWWEQYEPIIQTRFFNQLNHSLKTYGVKEIKKRVRKDIAVELDIRKSEAHEILFESQANRALLNKELETIKAGISQVRKNKESLESNQKNRKEFTDARRNLKHSEEKLKEVGLQLNKSLENIKIFDMKTGAVVFETSDLSTCSFSEEFFDSQLSALMRWKDAAEAERSIVSHHRDELSPLSNKIAALEKEQLLKKGEIKKNNEEIDECLRVSEVLKYLVNLYERFQIYSAEKALEDYQRVVQKLDTQMECFLISSVSIHDPSEEENLSSDLFERDFWSDVYEGTSVVDFILDNSLYASSCIRKILHNSVYIGPARDNPERFYLFSGNASQDITKTGKEISDLLFDNPELLKKVNEVLEAFNIGYTIQVVTFQEQKTSELSDMYAIRLVDKFLGVSVSPLDVGFGVSQILPIIVQSAFLENKTILIEQPEIHIHPRLQTELGELLVKSSKEQGNCFIIETHSEHLILRLQKLIREGNLSHEHISVLYVDREQQGSKILTLRLDSEGDFVDEWPGGFFEEGFEELF